MLRTVIRRIEQDLITSTITNRNLNPFFYQTIRWQKRKPRWLPTAKSKMFRINERKRLPLEEQEEIKRLYNNYRTELKSIRHFLATQVNKVSTENSTAAIDRNFEEDYQNCIVINEEWNKQIEKLREEVLAKEKEEQLERILETVEESKMKMIEEREKIEEIVRLEKERSKFYITRENIDEAIDKAIESCEDYNFAIDIEGNYYHGRKAKPQKVTKTEGNEVKQAAIA